MIYSLGDKAPQFLGERYYVAPSAELIGDIVLHQDASVWFNAVLRGDNEPIVIGEGSNVQDGAVLHTDPGKPLTIGDYVTIGHKVMLHGCEIGDHSLVGINAVILNGVKIGKNCIIGAQSMIPEGREIPDNSVVMGIPGKVVKTVSEGQAAMLRANAEVYIRNGARYREGLNVIREV